MISESNILISNEKYDCYLNAKGAYIKAPTFGFVTMFIVREKKEGGGIHRYI